MAIEKITKSLTQNEIYDKINEIVDDIPSTLPPNGTAGGDLSGSYPNPSVKDDSHNHSPQTMTKGDYQFSGSLSAFGEATVDLARANRFAFLPPECVMVEYSRDGGATWVNYDASDYTKTMLFTGETAVYMGGSSNADKELDNMVRITIDAWGFGTTGGKIYIGNYYSTVIKVSTYGATGCYCTIEKSLAGSPDNFTIVRNNVPVQGWSGINEIGHTISNFGGSASQLSNCRRIRYVFGRTGISSTYNSNMAVVSIKGYASNGYTINNNMAKFDRLYNYDNEQNALFPAEVKATDFILDGESVSDALETKANTSDIPTELSQLLEDDFHNTVTDEQITAWDNKYDVDNPQPSVPLLKGEDTRDINSTPGWYMTNKGKSSICVEFKTCQAIGAIGILTGTYCILETFIPWYNATGGLPIQLAYSANGGGTRAVRAGTSDTTWGEWRKSALDVSDVVNSSSSVTSASSKAVKTAYDKALEAITIANGKNRAKVFETKEAMEAWIAIPSNANTLQIGDNLYIEELGVPDYWWNGEGVSPLETQKVDLSNYYTETEADDKFVAKVEGKQLSTNDFTNDYKNKLTNLEVGNGDLYLNNGSIDLGSFNANSTSNKRIKISERYTLANWTGNGSPIRYYPICKFPIDNSSNSHSVILNGRLGGWTEDNLINLNLLALNRTVAHTGDAITSAGTLQGGINSFQTRGDIVVYQNADNSATMYIKCSGYFAFDITAKFAGYSAVNNMIVYNGQYLVSGGTATSDTAPIAPTGTLIYTLSTASSVTKSGYDGIMYATTPTDTANGEEVVNALWSNNKFATKAVATTTANGLMSNTDKTKLDGIAVPTIIRENN